MIAHVPVPEALRIPAAYESVLSLLRLHDPALRLRRSAEHPHLFVLERRCARASASNAGLRDLSDLHIQRRDGYIHVATTRLIWLTKPWNLIRALKQEGADLWAEGGAQKYAQEEEYEEQWMRESRRRRRMGLYRDIASEGFDLLNRMPGSDRSRINNPGLAPLAPA